MTSKTYLANVLDSQGRVVAVFRNVLVKERDLEVTRPKRLRFFMTLPEAVALAGLEPDVDVQVRFTQPEPGERMTEHLIGKGERVVPIAYPKVIRIERACRSRGFPVTRHKRVNADG